MVKDFIKNTVLLQNARFVISSPKIALCVIFILTAAVYGNAFFNGFIVDDHLFIVDWPLIKNLENFPQFFGSHNQPQGEEGVYSPIKTCIHALNYHFFGLNPLGYHFVALFIHLLGTAFVYRISLLLTRNYTAAFLSGLFFGIHPVHVEAITSLTGSVDTLGVVFLFISFYFYIQSQNDERFNCAAYVYSLLFALLAIFTHELTIVLPLLFLSYDFCFKTKTVSFSKVFLKIMPYFIFVAIYVGLKQTVLGSIARGGYLYDSFYLTMLVMVKVWAKYVFVCFLPFTLSASSEISKGIFSVDWRYFDQQAVLSQSIFDAQVLLSLFLTVAIIYWAIRMRRQRPLVSFCIAWFYISLLPVSNLIPFESYFAERYLYPGTLGFCLVLTYGLLQMYNYRGPSRQIFQWFSLALLVSAIVFYGVRTVARNSDFNNEKTFYESEVRANPHHPGMNRILGVIYLRNGQPLKALPLLKEVATLRPSDEDAYFALAETYTDLGEDTKAVENYLKAIEMNSEFAEAYYNLARLYAISKKMDKAKHYLGISIKIYRHQKRFSEAEAAAKIFYAYFGADKNLNLP